MKYQSPSLILFSAQLTCGDFRERLKVSKEYLCVGTFGGNLLLPEWSLGHKMREDDDEHRIKGNFTQKSLHFRFQGPRDVIVLT